MAPRRRCRALRSPSLPTYTTGSTECSMCLCVLYCPCCVYAVSTVMVAVVRRWCYYTVTRIVTEFSVTESDTSQQQKMKIKPNWEWIKKWIKVSYQVSAFTLTALHALAHVHQAVKLMFVSTQSGNASVLYLLEFLWIDIYEPCTRVHWGADSISKCQLA